MLILASGWTILLSVSTISVSVLLIGLILLQKNRGSGLSGAFGGVGGHSAFGTKTGDFLTWLTVGLVSVFLLLNVIGNYAFEPDDVAKQRAAQKAAQSGQPPAPTETPSGAPAGTSPKAPATTPPAGGTSATPPGKTPASPAPAPAGGTSPAGTPKPSGM